jgi:hypothetical protein
MRAQSVGRMSALLLNAKLVTCFHWQRRNLINTLHTNNKKEEFSKMAINGEYDVVNAEDDVMAVEAVAVEEEDRFISIGDIPSELEILTESDGYGYIFFELHVPKRYVGLIEKNRYNIKIVGDY